MLKWFKWLIMPASFNMQALASIPIGHPYYIPYSISPDNTTNKKVRWSSSNNSIATVDDEGIVTPIAVGECVITWILDCNWLTSTLSLTTYSIPVTWISLNELEVTLAPWETFQLEATITPEDASNKNVIWTSSNTSFVTVSSTWLVTCISEWECTITATTVDWWYTATCSISNWYVVNSNTLSYFPFTEDFVDKAGNRTLTVNDCAINDWSAKINSKSSYMTLSSWVWWSQMTISVWYYYWWNSTDWWWNTLFARTWWTYHHLLFPAKTDNGTIWDIWFYNSSKYLSSTILRLNNWYHIVVVKSWTNEKIYINSELAFESNSSFDNNSYPVWTIANYNSWQSQWAQGRMSDLIFESWTWDQTKISKYFNISKKRYQWTIKDYQELEYIQSTWTQYIDTLFRLNTTNKTDSFEWYIKATHTWSWNFLWTKSSTSSPTYMTMEVVSSATTTLRCFIANSSTYTDRAVLHDNNTTIDEITYRYTSSLATFIINWTTYTQSRSSWYNMWWHCVFIFCRNNWWDATEQLLSMKMYWCKLYIWWVLERDFMPCKRRSDWTIWLWDKVYWVFYFNAWSWNFTAWPVLWVSLDTNSISLPTAGDTYQLTPTTNPASIAEWWFTWSSSDESIATVSNTWLVTCVTPGDCTITCTANSTGDFDTCTVSEIKIFEIYYDFRWWSLAWWQAAWWAWVYTNWSYTIDSWWLWQTNGSNDRNTAAYITWLDFSNAKSFYMERLWYWVRNSWSNWKGMWAWTSYNNSGWVNAPYTWWRINLNTSSPETYSTNWVNYHNWSSEVTNYAKYAANGWETTERLEVNLETWALNYILTWANSRTFSLTLNATQIATIKNFTAASWNRWRWYSDYNNERIRWVKIHIES